MEGMYSAVKAPIKTILALANEGSVDGLLFHQGLKEILPLNTADINYDIKTAL